MTHLIHTFRSALSNAVLFSAFAVMAGLGFAVLGTLALSALLAVGIAMIASPFVSQRRDATIDA